MKKIIVLFSMTSVEIKKKNEIETFWIMIISFENKVCDLIIKIDFDCFDTSNVKKFMKILYTNKLRNENENVKKKTRLSSITIHEIKMRISFKTIIFFEKSRSLSIDWFAFHFDKLSFSKKNSKSNKMIAIDIDFFACCVRVENLYDDLRSKFCVDVDLSTCCKIIVNSSFLFFANRFFEKIFDDDWCELK